MAAQLNTVAGESPDANTDIKNTLEQAELPNDARS